MIAIHHTVLIAYDEHTYLRSFATHPMGMSAENLSNLSIPIQIQKILMKSIHNFFVTFCCANGQTHMQ